MRIAEYKQIDSETVTNTIPVDDVDEAGEVIGSHEETITKTIPIMGMVYRDATPEEVAEAERMANEMPTPPADPIEELKKQNEMLLECVLEMSEIVYGE